MGISLEIQFVFMIGLPIWIISRLIVLIKRKNNEIKINIFEEILNNLFIIYFFILIGITIFPIYIGDIPDHIASLSLYERINLELIPFVNYMKESMFISVLVRNLGGNLLLLIPFIGYLCVKNKKIRSIKRCTLAAFYISFTIEITQMLLNILNLSFITRAVSTEDLILNTLGGIFGFYIFKFLYRGKVKDYIDSNFGKFNKNNNEIIKNANINEIG